MMIVSRFAIALTACLALTGCAADANDPSRYVDFPSDRPVDAVMVRREYSDAAGLAYDCVRTFGTLTTDHRACLVRRWGVCFYLTRVGDRVHDRELTARCNGWGLRLEIG